MIDTVSTSPARADIPAGLRVGVVGRDLWRVTDLGGRVRAHVRLLTADGARRYRVERFDPRDRAFRSVGEFWSARDALECVRYQR